MQFQQYNQFQVGHSNPANNRAMAYRPNYKIAYTDLQ